MAIGGAIKIVLSANASKATPALDKVGGSLGKIASAGLGVVGVFTQIAATIASASVIITRFLDRARKTELATEAMHGLGGGIADAEARLGGFASQYDIILARNRAVQLGLDLTADQFANLAEKAAKAGLVMGQDVNQSINDIILGIGRQSRLILDNLGIIVRVEKAYERYAAKIGIATKDLSDHQKKIAFTEDAMKALERAASGVTLEVHTGAAAWKVLQISIRNANDAISEAISKYVLLIKVLKALKEGVDFVTDNVRFQNSLTEAGQQIHEASKASAEYNEELKKLQAEGILTGAQVRRLTTGLGDFKLVAQLNA